MRLKKWVAIITILVLLTIGGIYLLSPATNIYNYQTTVNCTEAGAARLTTDTNQWHKWWPGKKNNSSDFHFAGYDYKVINFFINGFNTIIYKGDDSVLAVFQLTRDAKESTNFVWKLTYNFSDNVVKQVVQNFAFKGFQTNIEKLNMAMKKYFDEPGNIYGIKITQQIVADTSMISLKRNFDHYPTSNEIFGMIDSVKNYIALNAGEENNFPMLNVYNEDSATYQTMVAVPTKRLIAGNNLFELKRMIRGNILVAEIKGGLQSIRNGEIQLNNYVQDYGKSSPAIPYHSLVTNRMQEQDTAKWITKLYFPIFY